MTDQERGQNHDPEHEESYGMALGFGIVEDGGDLFLAEAEISPYVDEPGELGVTLVFHPLAGLNPIDSSEESEWPAWPLDVDDDLTRDGTAPVPEQFQAILRQLRGLSEAQLREYLAAAREQAEEE